jgi:hypothetical protein
LVSAEKEKLMGYRAGHSSLRFSDKEVESLTASALEDDMCCSLAISFHCPCIALALGAGLRQSKMVATPSSASIFSRVGSDLLRPPLAQPAPWVDDLSPDEASETLKSSDAWVASCAELASIQSDLLAGELVGVSETSQLVGTSPSAALVYEYLRRMDGRGSDVRQDLGVSMRPMDWPRYSVDPHRWLWRVSVATPWRFEAHINELELKMFQLTLQWKTRQLIHFESRFLHLLDSQVSIAVAVKGRSSSRRLNQILRKIAAVSISADLYPLLAYIASALNPADGASRRFDQWRKVKKN